MKTRVLGAGLTCVAVIGLALACEKGSPTSAPAASKVSGISASAQASTDEQKVRWDIISIDFSVTPHPVTSGGMASALANDGSKITLTGSGTFRSNPGNAQDVTGGGTWETFANGSSTGSGTYEVTGLVSFVVAPGTPPTTNLDLIGTAAHARAGLVFLRVAYSDGSGGVLAVSCHLVGTPDAVFEGVTASKGVAGFWNLMAPSGTVNANRTVFHVINDEED